MNNKPHIVEVVRYIRPDEFDLEPHSVHTNLYGITIIYKMDYAAEVVEARFSICNGDNFSKEEGIQLAKNSVRPPVFFPLVKGKSLNISLIEILDPFWSEYTGGQPHYNSVRSFFYHEMEEIFLRSIRNQGV